MGKTIGQFSYTLISNKDSKFPANPAVYIDLKSCMQPEKGMPIISPHLMIESEVDSHIEALKADLDDVGRRAKLALKRAKSRN